MKSFGLQVEEFTKKYKKRLRATARTAVQETANIANLPRSKGGRLRFQTGFLHSTMAGNVGSMPIGESENNADGSFSFGTFIGEPLAVSLLRWEPSKDTFYVGWTANYARPREYRDGYMRGATELWPRTVDRVVKEVRARI